MVLPGALVRVRRLSSAWRFITHDKVEYVGTVHPGEPLLVVAYVPGVLLPGSLSPSIACAAFFVMDATGRFVWLELLVGDTDVEGL